MNPDSAVEPTTVRAKGEPEVAKTLKRAVFKVIFALFAADGLKVLAGTKHRWSLPVGRRIYWLLTKGLLLASASRRTAESGMKQTLRVARLKGSRVQ